MKEVSLAQAIRRLRPRRSQLEDTAPFFKKHAKDWHRRAQGAVRSVGRSLRPDEVEVEKWEQYLEGLVGLVALWFVQPDADGDGVDIDLRAMVKGKGLIERGPLTMTDILSWVRAGEDGDPLGKHLDERDREYEPEQIAQRVYFAWKFGAMSGDSIREFLSERGVGAETLARLLDALLAIWLAQLLPRIKRDWRQWVRDQVRV